MTCRLWLCLASLLALPRLSWTFNCSDVRPQRTCDDTCQYCQQQALLTYIWPLNGPNWRNRAGWPSDGDMSLYVPEAHCSWYGVYCCGSDFTLLNVADPATLRYTVTNRTSCQVPFGVSIILLGNNGLNGSISTDIFSLSALRVSLEVFSAESKPLRDFQIPKLCSSQLHPARLIQRQPVMPYVLTFALRQAAFRGDSRHGNH